MTDITPEPIFQLATGFMAAKHLFIANEIGLFAVLADGPAPLDRLATRTGIARPRVRILADALVTLGLIGRHGDQYQNGPVAAAFLSGTGPANLGPGPSAIAATIPTVRASFFGIVSGPNLLS
jgi:hypothetical protein